LGDLSNLAAIVEERDIQEVIVAASLPAQAIRQVAECCFDHGAALYAVPPVSQIVDCRAEPLRMGSCALIRLHPARLEVPSLLLKRAFDVVIASLMLVVAIPLMALIAAAIKLDSPGPVFYRARRVGLGGTIFSMWKFRSMAMDAEQREQELAHLNIYPG